MSSPGPWHISGYDSNNGTPACISAADGEAVCALYRRNPNNQSNAQLIVGAPAMAAALLAILSRWHSLDPRRDQQDRDAILGALRAAGITSFDQQHIQQWSATTP